MKLAPGTIISNYEIISLLGEGGMGEVYLAKENLLDRKVAIKRLNPILTSDQAFADRFVNEAHIQAKLLHSNIVGLYNFFIDRGTYYMVLEYAEGINLRELITRTGPIVEDRTLHIFRQIIAALAFAHEKQIVHRDIKPSNIIIGVGDSVKILDFGIARLLSDQHLTRTGSKLGTLFYMSPEQVMAVKDIDHRSDIYSAGVVLFEMLSGRLPFDRNTDSDYVIQHAIVSAEIPDPRTFYPHVSETTV
ncbi:MAG: serine/threonine protein kinase, partial [Candidatus Cloacimonetes bacterium]|nr:serine/threonine protein kinase [Candidatus Cloacimonadota bacterium]